MMSLKEEVLEKIFNKKKLEDTTLSFDIKGNSYRSPVYLVPPFYIDEVSFSEVLAKEENFHYLTEGSIIAPPGVALVNRRKKKALATFHGRLGRGVFEQIPVFFDFPRGSIYFTEDKKNFQERLRDFVKTPFLAETIGVILLVQTDRGQKRFLLDTGVSHSFVRGTPAFDKFLTKQFVIGETDYGLCTLFVFDLPKLQVEGETGDYDGVLGIDFLRRHAFCLDFETKTAYFQPPRKTLWQRLNDFF